MDGYTENMVAEISFALGNVALWSVIFFVQRYESGSRRIPP